MNPRRCFLVVLLTLVFGLFFCVDVKAQKGRGKGHFKGHAANNWAGGMAYGHKSYRGQSSFAREIVTGSQAGLSNPLQNGQPTRIGPNVKQPLVEQRKLEHRQQIADQLRQIGESNGNSQLFDTADRLEEHALLHYEKRMANINAGSGSGESPIPAPAPIDGLKQSSLPGERLPASSDPHGTSVLEKFSQDSGRENEDDRRLLNE
jgi:hypothetical protein